MSKSTNLNVSNVNIYYKILNKFKKTLLLLKEEEEENNNNV